MIMAKQSKIDSKSKLKRVAIDLQMSTQMDIMSDDQLKVKLSQHGYPNMPITTTTRNTLIKMLKNTPRLTTKPQTSGKIVNISDTSTTIVHNSECKRQTINGRSALTSDHRNTLSTNNKIAIKKSKSTSVSQESPDRTNEEMNTKSDRRKIPTVTTNRDMSKNNEVALMTDEQLRTALLKYGFGNIPITDTTRCTLKNKLKIYIYNINFTFTLIDNTYCDSTDIRTSNKAKCGHHAKTEEVRFQRITHTVCKLCSKQCDSNDNLKLKKSERKSLKMATLETDFTFQGTSKVCKLCSKQRDTIDNSKLKKSERKSLKTATLETDVTCQGNKEVHFNCSSKTKKRKNQPLTVSMQHGTLHHSFTRVQRRMWNFQMTSVHDNQNNRSSDNEEPFEEIINRFLGNSYPLSGFSNYW